MTKQAEVLEPRRYQAPCPESGFFAAKMFKKKFESADIFQVFAAKM